VLFLDELPEFPRPLLEALRQPLEERRVPVARSREAAEYPAEFILVAAMNPCPCGFLGQRGRGCRCPAPTVARYRRKISGPLLDRIDLQLELSAISFEEWAREGAEAVEPSSAVRERVARARALSLARAGRVNACLAAPLLREACRPDRAAWTLAESASRKLALSARALDRLLRVSRTLADLEGGGSVGERHVAEALLYRSLERPLEI
jgi:magnesium chelatase family protein